MQESPAGGRHLRPRVVTLLGQLQDAQGPYARRKTREDSRPFSMETSLHGRTNLGVIVVGRRELGYFAVEWAHGMQMFSQSVSVIRERVEIDTEHEVVNA